VPSAITRCQLLWHLPELGPSSASALDGEGIAALVVDAYLATPHLTCCSFQLGFHVDVDGVPWSDEGTLDEPRMTWSWVRALTELCGGAGAAHAVPWEESSLTLVREGDVVTMEDVHGSGRVSMRRVAVSLRELSTRMHGELAAMAVAIRAVRTEASARIAAGAGEREKLEVILRELPADDEHGLPMIAALGRVLER
jgi:hypothetical protein